MGTRREANIVSPMATVAALLLTLATRGLDRIPAAYPGGQRLPLVNLAGLLVGGVLTLLGTRV